MPPFLNPPLVSWSWGRCDLWKAPQVLSSRSLFCSLEIIILPCVSPAPSVCSRDFPSSQPMSGNCYNPVVRLLLEIHIQVECEWLYIHKFVKVPHEGELNQNQRLCAFVCAIRSGEENPRGLERYSESHVHPNPSRCWMKADLQGAKSHLTSTILTNILQPKESVRDSLKPSSLERTGQDLRTLLLD